MRKIGILNFNCQGKSMTKRISEIKEIIIREFLNVKRKLLKNIFYINRHIKVNSKSNQNHGITSCNCLGQIAKNLFLTQELNGYLAKDRINLLAPVTVALSCLKLHSIALQNGKNF